MCCAFVRCRDARARVRTHARRAVSHAYISKRGVHGRVLVLGGSLSARSTTEREEGHKKLLLLVFFSFSYFFFRSRGNDREVIASHETTDERTVGARVLTASSSMTASSTKRTSRALMAPVSCWLLPLFSDAARSRGSGDVGDEVLVTHFCRGCFI